MEKQTLGRSIMTWLAVLLPVLALALGGCSGDSAPQAPINAATATVAAAADGKTDNEVTAATPDGSSTVTIPKGTAMYADAAKTQPVSGTLTVSTTTLATVSALPAAAQTGTLAGVGAVLDSVVAVADVTISNGITSVAAFGSPITVNLKLPAGYAAVGSSVDYYSFDASGTWTKEGTATVKADNSIDMIVSHLSGWGVATFTSSTGFTTAMLSGKTLDFSISNGSRGTITFKADQTVTALRTAPGNETMTGTWSVNASGQAVITFSFGEVNTLTLTSATATSIVSALSWTNPNNPSDTGSGTMTLTVADSTSSGFTTDMLSGKTLTLAYKEYSVAPLKLNVDGTVSYPMVVNWQTTWSVANGVLVISVNSSVGAHTEYYTPTTMSTTADGISGSGTQTLSSSPGESLQITFTVKSELPTATGFTSSMLSGKTFTSSDHPPRLLKADGTVDADTTWAVVDGALVFTYAYTGMASYTWTYKPTRLEVAATNASGSCRLIKSNAQGADADVTFTLHN